MVDLPRYMRPGGITSPYGASTPGALMNKPSVPTTFQPPPSMGVQSQMQTPGQQATMAAVVGYGSFGVKPKKARENKLRNLVKRPNAGNSTMPKGVPKQYMKSRKKSIKVAMRKWVKHTLDNHMPVEEGLAYLDKQSEQFKKDYW